VNPLTGRKPDEHLIEEPHSPCVNEGCFHSYSSEFSKDGSGELYQKKDTEGW